MSRVANSPTRAKWFLSTFVLIVSYAVLAQNNPPLVITSTSLPNGIQNTVYGAALSATGGQGAYAWSITNGILPPGLSLDTNAGVISGTPQSSGVSSVTFQVTDAAQMTANAVLTITVGGPVLQLRINNTPGTVNLSDPNNMDWVIWGADGSTPAPTRGPAGLITDLMQYKTNSYSANSLGYVLYDWTNGNPISSGSNVAAQVVTNTQYSGFQISVPADTSVKTLIVYAGVHVNARLNAVISDGSSPAINDSSVTAGGETDTSYSIDFRAGSAGQTLTVTLTSTDPNGYVALQAAALQPHLPQVALTSPQFDQSYPLSGVATINMNASQYDNALASGQIWEQNEQDQSITIPGPIWQSNPPASYTGTLEQNSVGVFQFESQITDAAGLTGTAPPVEAFVIGSGGSLSVLANQVKPFVDLTGEGTADWVLFGPSTSGSGIAERKANVGQIISGYTLIGNHTSTTAMCCGPVQFAFEDGTPDPNGANDNPLAYEDGVGNGFQLTLYADTTPRNLRLYAGTDYGSAQVQAFLSDGSAAVVVDTSLSSPDGSNWTAYTIAYQAASAGQTLTVRFTLAQEADWGDVKLYAATVDGTPAPLVTVSSLLNPSTQGGLATFTATVSGYDFQDNGPPAVMFFDGSAQLGLGVPQGQNPGNPCAVGVPVGVISQGGNPGTWTVTFSSATLQAGIHPVTAVLWSNNLPSSPPSPVFQQTVSGLAVAVPIGVTSSASTATWPTAVTLTANVPANATGAVVFCDGISGNPVNIGIAAINGGVAVVNFPALAKGVHPITVIYAGDGNYSAANASTVQTIIAANPMVALTVLGPGGNPAPNPAVYGTSLTLQATMPPSVTGTVTFMDSGASIGSGALSPVLDANGNLISMMASFTTSAMAAGTHSLTAFYSGDANNSSATSAAVSIVITAAPAITGISSPSGAAGDSVVIRGSGFGSVQSSSTASFNGIVATATAWSDSAVTATVPNGPVTGNIVVTVGGQPSNGWAFTGTSPAITGISPRSAPVGLPVTINGVNFGASQGLSTVTFNSGLIVTPTSWSDTQIVAVVPASATNGPVVVQVGGYTTQASFYVQSPLLQLAINPAAGEVNLSNPVNFDWAVWGADGVDASITRDAETTAPLISDITVLNGATVNANTQGYVLYDWSNGTPLQSGSQVAAQVVANGLNNGFQVTVPASTAVQTLTLYVGVHVSAQLTASLSDNSSPAINAPITAGGESDDAFSIDFRAASAGQTLTVTLLSTDPNGYVALQAATLSPHLPNVAITSPKNGVSFAAPNSIPVAIQAWQYGASMADVQVSENGSQLFDWQTSPYSSTWPQVAAGHYQLQGQATDVTGLTTTSQPASIDVIGSGGSLSESLVQALPSVDLTQQGTADWVIFGPTCNTAVCAQAGLNSLERKAGVSPFISPYRTIGNHTGTVAVCCAPEQFAYEDGTPDSLENAVGPLAYMDGVGNGFQLTVGADTNTRTLWLYASADYGQAQLQAYLSDGSAAPVVDQSLNNAGSAAQSVYSITYNAASAGQTLTVLLTLQQEYDWGDVELYAAALTGPPTSGTLPSGVILTSSPNPTQVGNNVTFTATITPAAATGTVTFYDGKTALGAVPLGTANLSGSNVVTFSTAGLASGTHLIVASYSGDQTYGPSSSSVLTQAVGLVGTITEICSAGLQTGCAGGTQAGLTALVDTGGGAPTGTVNLRTVNMVFAPVTVQPQAATNLLPYSETLDGPGTGWQAASQDSVTVMVGATPNPLNGLNTASEFTLPAVTAPDCAGWFTTANPGVAVAGQTFTFSIWLKAKASVSQITLAIQDPSLSSVPCQAVGNTVMVGPQWQRYSVAYTFAANSTATAVNTMLLSSAASPAFVDAWGAQLEAATFAGPYVPTNGASSSGFGGIATWPGAPTAGTYTAVYSGDGTFNTSTSAPLAIGANPAPEVALTSSSNPSASGASVALAAIVSPQSGTLGPTPTGVVLFYDTGTLISKAALDKTGTALFTTATLAAGSHSVSAVYGGDGNYSGAISPAIQQVIYAPLAITTTSLPSGTPGTSYSATLSASGGSGNYSWSIISGVLPAGLALNPNAGTISGTPPSQGVNNMTFQVADGQTTASVTLSLTVAGPVLQLRINTTPGTVNLSDPNANNTDWITWGDQGGTTVLTRNSGTPQSSQINAGSYGDPASEALNTLGYVLYDWSGGTPVYSGTGVAGQWVASGIANGFTLRVQADTSVQTLTIYAGVHINASLQAVISDGSSPSVTDTSVTAFGETDVAYSIDFRAASGGQYLSVNLGSTDPNGYVSLQAAALQPHLPQVQINPLQCGANLCGSVFSFPAATSFSENVLQYDYAITDVQALANGSEFFDWQLPPYTTTWSPPIAGHCVLRGQATDALGEIGVAQPIEVDAVSSGGTLQANPSIYTAPASSAINLSGEADWVLFGPTTAGGSGIERMADVSPLVSNYTLIGNHTETDSYCCSPQPFSFSGGTPDPTETSVAPLAYEDGVNNGFQFTVYADTNSRSLIVWAGVDYGTVQLQAFLSDGSAVPITDTSLTNPDGSAWAQYFITYSAASAGQTLTVRVTLQQEFDWGDVKLFGATVWAPPLGSAGTASTMTLSSTPNPSQPGANVTFTAAVAPSSATGTVSLTDGSVLLASLPLASGSASFSTSGLASGTHTITATYSGDSTYAASTSVPLTQSVGQLAGTITEICNVVQSSGQPGCPAGPPAGGAASGLFAMIDTGGASLAFGSQSETAVFYSGSTVLNGAVLQPQEGANWLPYSEMFDGPGTGWQSLSFPLGTPPATVNVGAGPNPLTGAYTASEITLPAVAPGTCAGWEAVLPIPPPGPAGLTWTYSVWLKAKSSVSNLIIAIQDPTMSTSCLLSGTLIAVGPQWQRFSVNYPFSSSSQATSLNAVLLNATNSPAVIEAWGAQVEQAPFARPYVSTSGAGRHAWGAVASWSPSSGSVTPGSYTAAFSGDASFANSASAALVTSLYPPPIVELATSANPAAAGGTITYTATVIPSGASPIPTGTALLYDTGNPIGSAPLDATGTATFTTAALSTGFHSISAYYEPAGSSPAATSNAIEQQLVAPTMSLDSSNQSATYGSPVNFWAILTPPTCTGSVSFSVAGFGSLGVAAIGQGGTASITVASMPAAGSYTVTATYTGDTNCPPLAAAIAETVAVATPTVVLTSSPNPSPYGAVVTLTATLSPSECGGSVSFSIPLPPGSVSSSVAGGVATYGLSGLKIGSYAIDANYLGDPNCYAENAAQLTQTVTMAATTTTLTSSPNPSAYGQSVTFTATLTPASTESGTVAFAANGTAITGCAAVAVLSAKAICAIAATALPTGTDTIVATYSGDSNFTGSSGSLTQVVNKAATSTALVSNPNPSTYAQPITLTATIMPAASETGVVAFAANGTAITGCAAVAVLSAKAICAIAATALPTGTDTIVATYSGDSNFTGSSGSLTQVVNKAATSTALVSNPNPSTYAQPITLTATIMPAASETGVVAFTANGTAITGCTAVTVSSPTVICTIAPASLPADWSYNIVATYSGDSNYQGSTGTATQNVTPAPTSTALSSSSDPSAVGQSVTFTATLMPALNESGTVAFTENGAAIAGCSAVAVSAATAACATAGLPTGAIAVVATYSGDHNFIGSGADLTQNVVTPANIISMAPASGPVLSTVFINGTGFGATQGQVNVNGSQVTYIFNWTETQIAFQVPSEATSGLVQVIAGGVPANSSQTFTVTACDCTRDSDAKKAIQKLPRPKSP